MFNPNDYGFLIATELRRIGEEKGKAIMILKAWNSGNSQALKLRELNGIIGRAYSKLYVYGCNNVMLVKYCPGKENCTYYKSLFTRTGRYRERDFKRFSDFGRFWKSSGKRPEDQHSRLKMKSYQSR